MAILINDNYSLSANKPFDARYLNISTPWASCAAAIAGIPTYRYSGLTVNIAGDEWWWKDGVGDGDLVLKTQGGSGSVSGATNGLQLLCSGTYIGLGGALTQNTTICGAYTLNLGNVASGLTAITAVTPTFHITDAGQDSSLSFCHNEDTPHFDVCLYGANANSNADMVLDVDVTNGCFSVSTAPNTICYSELNLRTTDTNVPVFQVQSINSAMEYYNEACIGSSKLTCVALVDTSNSALNIKSVMDYDTRSWEFCKDDAVILSILSGGTARYGSNVTLTNDCDLAHKWYVDNATGTLSGANGLTKDGNNIVLGGTLTGATTVAGSTTCSLSLTQVNAGTSAYMKFQGEDVIDLKVYSGTTFSNSETGLQIGQEYFRLMASDNSNTQSMEFNTTDMTVTDAINSKGLVYGGAYRSNFTPLSLVDKCYVDLCAAASGIQSAANGLTKTGTVVTLGGTLTGNTTIVGGSNSMLFNGLQTFTVTGVSASICGTTNIALRTPSFTLHNGVGNVLTFDTSCNKITDIVNSEGLVYASNYCAVGQNNPRWIPDAAYVTGLTSGFINTANNGLTKVGQNVVLGGTLTGATNICLGGGAALQTFKIQGSGLTTCSVLDMNGATVGLCASNVNSPNQTGRVTVGSSGSIICSGFADCYSAINMANSIFNICISGGTNNAFMRITDGSTSPRGLEYAACYHSTYCDRSLVDKEYVDYEISGATSGITGAITTANNGLTKVGQNVRLGGSLTGETSINAGSNTFFVWGGGGDIAMCLYGSDCCIELYANNSDIQLGNTYVQLQSGSNIFGVNTGATTYTSDDGTGICYAGDYETTFANRSLVTKQYVSGVTSGITGAVTSANNGLTKVGQNVVLGGTLTGTTEIDIGTNTFRVCHTGDNSCIALSPTEARMTVGCISQGFGNIVVSSTSIGITSQSGGTNASMNLQYGTGNVTFVSNGTLRTSHTASGLYYNSNYSGTGGSNPRWIPDVNWVTGQTSTSGVQTVLNGLTKIGTIAYLGGNIVAPTTLSLSGASAQYVICNEDNLGWATSNGSCTISFGDLDSNTTWIEMTCDACAMSICSQCEITMSAAGGATLHLCADGNFFSDDTANKRGLQYGGSYEATFVDTSLVTKKYVLDCINTLTGITSSAITGATNGLCEVNNDVKLGGALTENTSIGTSAICQLDVLANVVSLSAATSVNMGVCSAAITLNNSGNGYLCLQTDYASLSFATGSTSANAGEFTDKTANQWGIVYAGCYSTGFTNDCSVVDKGYVDAKITIESNTVAAVCNVTTNYTALCTDEFIGVSGATQISLPATPKPRQRVSVADICGNALAVNICVLGNGMCINGNDGATINTDYGAMTFVNNGYSWSAIAFIN